MAKQVKSYRKTATRPVFGTDTRFKGSKAENLQKREDELRAKGLMKPQEPLVRHEADEIKACEEKTSKYNKSGGFSVGTSFGTYPKKKPFTAEGKLTSNAEGNTYNKKPRKAVPGPGTYSSYNILEKGAGDLYRTSTFKKDGGRSFGVAPPNDKSKFPFMA